MNLLDKNINDRSKIIHKIENKIESITNKWKSDGFVVDLIPGINRVYLKKNLPEQKLRMSIEFDTDVILINYNNY